MADLVDVHNLASACQVLYGRYERGTTWEATVDECVTLVGTQEKNTLHWLENTLHIKPHTRTYENHWTKKYTVYTVGVLKESYVTIHA